MMKWWFANIAGIGECLFQSEMDLSNQYDDSELIEIHKLTHLVINPNSGQVGYMRNMASNPNLANGAAMLRKSSIVIFSEARPAATKDMENVWAEQPKKGIVLPSADDVARLKKLP